MALRRLTVLEGAGGHGAGALAVPDTITLLPLPPYAPELNPIENVRACLRANRLGITVFETCDEIVTRCSDAWNLHRHRPLNHHQRLRQKDYAKTVKG